MFTDRYVYHFTQQRPITANPNRTKPRKRYGPDSSGSAPDLVPVFFPPVSASSLTAAERTHAEPWPCRRVGIADIQEIMNSHWQLNTETHTDTHHVDPNSYRTPQPGPNLAHIRHGLRQVCNSVSDTWLTHTPITSSYFLQQRASSVPKLISARFQQCGNKQINLATCRHSELFSEQFSIGHNADTNLKLLFLLKKQTSASYVLGHQQVFFPSQHVVLVLMKWQ